TARVLAVDIDPRAVDLARRNLERAGPGRGRVLQADLTGPAALAGQAGFDAVLSNPPYVPSDAVPRDQEVRDHDPPHALYGSGQDSLSLPRFVSARSAALVTKGGTLIIEHADVKGEATPALTTPNRGFQHIETAADLTGRDLYLITRRAPDDQPDGSGSLT